MLAAWQGRARALALLGAGLGWLVPVGLAPVAVIGCGVDLDTVGSLDRLPEGSAERIRILAPAEPASTDAIMPITIERLAHEGDEPGRDAARVRCVVVRAIGAARLVDLASSGSGTLTTRDELQLDLDRGDSRRVGLAAVTDGSALVWARLVDSTCPATGDAPTLHEASRTVRFEAGDLLPLDVDAGVVP